MLFSMFLLQTLILKDLCLELALNYISYTNYVATTEKKYLYALWDTYREKW